MYGQLQRRFGNLRPDPFGRVPHHVTMLQTLGRAGFDVDGARCLEVGTGHLPTLPILFHLAGAKNVLTVDLHRRVQWDLVRDAMRALSNSVKELVAIYEGLVDEVDIRKRLQTMSNYSDRPADFLTYAGIEYLAPADAAVLPEPADSFDLHFSTTVLEHIEPSALTLILREAARVLRVDGVALHIIDPSDHFAHSDESISLINFLRFSGREWDKIAGNEFGYCNRLRAPELLGIFSEVGLDVITNRAVVDDNSLREIESGFPLDPSFAHFTPRELCTVKMEVTARAY